MAKTRAMMEVSESDKRKEFKIEKVLMEDSSVEDNFLDAVKKANPAVREQIKTELEIMVKVYNEQVENYARLRFDASIHRELMEMEPDYPAHKESMVKADEGMKLQRINVKHIKNQILILAGGNKLE